MMKRNFSRPRLLLAIAGGIVAALWILVLFYPLPSGFYQGAGRTTRITDRYGRKIYDVRAEGLSEFLSIRDVPSECVQALISTEDRTFYSHPGLSARGIARAFLHDVRAGAFVEGGSTITQQTVRSVLQPVRRSIPYKAREAALALMLDARRSKEQILELFFNSAYFGQQSYGLAAAARTYLDKSPQGLSVSECALLVGLVNAPSALNPFKDPDAALERRRLVLNAMRSNGVLDDNQYEEAVRESLTLSHGKVTIEAPHFVFWLLPQLNERQRTSDAVRTTIDLDLQHEVEQIIQRHLSTLKEKNVTSAAVVVLDAKTGELLTMVGSSDYFDEEHDGAVNVATSLRQPGSALKPFTYALALASGMTPSTTVSDVEARFLTQDGNPYTPRNYDYKEHGLVRLREALANSYNIAAVKVLQSVGVQKLVDFLTAAGITSLHLSPEHYGLALTLGDAEVRLLDLTRAYAALARGGYTVDVRAVPEGTSANGARIMDPRIAWLISDILSDDDARLAEFGESGPLNFPFDVAVKTGTTRNSRDNWTVGYTPRFVAGVWVGNADNTPMKGTSGVTGAGPIFHDVMLAAENDGKHERFLRPDGIVEREICRLSGKLTTDLCPDRIHEYFLTENVPTERDDMYLLLTIDPRNGLLGANCDASLTEKRLLVRFPAEIEDWARRNGWNVAPTVQSPLCGLDRVADAPIIRRPANGASYKLDPLVPDSSEKIVFEATSASPDIVWLVDGVQVGAGVAPDYRFSWQPTPGSHTVEALSNGSSSKVTILVE